MKKNSDVTGFSLVLYQFGLAKIQYEMDFIYFNLDPLWISGQNILNEVFLRILFSNWLL